MRAGGNAASRAAKTHTENSPTLFRDRLRSGELLLGSMLKTPTVHSTEIYASIGFDFVMVDSEHAPFDLHELDMLALAAHAGGIASLVRVPDANPSRLLGILDLGFTGVAVPHVASVPIAEAIVRACRFVNGNRGFSPSCRAGKYGGRDVNEHIDFGDRSATVVAMVEDVEALDVIDSIVAVEGIDAIFIGRGDLAVAMGERSVNAPRVQDAVDRILKSCRAAHRTAILHVNEVSEAAILTQQGASAFTISTDQGLLRAAAQNIRNSFGRNCV